MGAFEIYDETYDIHELPRWERFTKDNDFMMLFWEKQGYSLRTNPNYRNKSLNERIPTGR